MKIIVGLGNPGPEYELTPHNIGFLAIDRLADAWDVEVRNRHCRALTGRAKVGLKDGRTVEVLLAKPETFMNLSGASVRELLAKYGGEGFEVKRDLIVIYDEADLPLGRMRIRERGSSAGHKGAQSVIQALGSQEFMRIRLGIAPDRPLKGKADYVLTAFKKKDWKTVTEQLDRCAQAVEKILDQGVAAAMNEFNRRETDDE